MMHHHPVMLLLKTGKKTLLVAGALLVFASPVTWGAGLAIYDAATGGNTGAWLVSGTPAKPVAKVTPHCDVLVDGKKYRVWTDCSKVQFPGKKVRA
jgi:hypothetical protein